MTALATQSLSPSLDRLREAFERRFPGDDAITQWRRGALERFLELGFPTQRDERWKYTNLRRLEMRKFTPADAPRIVPPLPGTLSDASLRVALVDGHCMPSLGHGAQPPGITMFGLGQWLKNDPAEVAAYLRRLGPDPESAFENLNAAFLEDGLVIDVAAGTQWDEPIYVVHAWHTSGRMAHPRIVVRLGENSRCTLIEHYIGGAQVESFTNAVITIEAQTGACLEHYRLQQESPKTFHISTVRARLAKDAHYYGHEIALGAGLGRADITGLLEGPGAEMKLRGLFAPTGSQHLDTYTRIEHIAPYTTSEEEFRGIADGRGRGVFNGKVKVHPHAQRIDARQLSRNLLLSPTAEIDTKPELEIYANDVKCSHGATTGQLDATALFYLRSRGIDADTARALLIRAFAESILTSIEPKGLRETLEEWLTQRFSRTEAQA
ncbi:MAG TPA: Fe-S cluster assembly protein SufD [Steroidobacteraceae bacterium]